MSRAEASLYLIRLVMLFPRYVGVDFLEQLLAQAIADGTLVFPGLLTPPTGLGSVMKRTYPH